MLKLNLKDNQRVLRYRFDFLDCAEADVFVDAFREFQQAKDVDVGSVTRSLPADKVRALVRNPGLERQERGTCAYLLGHCGAEKDAVLLRKMVEVHSGENAPTPHEDTFKGYVLLRPLDGWNTVRRIMSTNEISFRTRYRCLKTARFLYSQGREIIPKMEIIRAIADLLDDPDMADLCIEDLRRWKCRDYSERVISLAQRKSHHRELGIDSSR